MFWSKLKNLLFYGKPKCNTVKFKQAKAWIWQMITTVQLTLDD